MITFTEQERIKPEFIAAVNEFHSYEELREAISGLTDTDLSKLSEAADNLARKVPRMEGRELLNEAFQRALSANCPQLSTCTEIWR